MDLSAIGQQFGLDPAQTEAAVTALAPVIAAGLRRNATSGEDMGAVLETLRQGERDGRLATPTDAGNLVLGQIFESKDVSRGVAQQLSAGSGVSSDILKKLLPIIATYFISQMMTGRAGGSAQAAAAPGGGLGDLLGGMLGGSASAGTPRSAVSRGGSGDGLGDLLGGILGGGAAPSRAPAQGGSGGSFGDLLGGVLGGGQGQAGGGLGDILGQVLGGANSKQSTAADDLLASVQASLRRR